MLGDFLYHITYLGHTARAHCKNQIVHTNLPMGGKMFFSKSFFGNPFEYTRFLVKLFFFEKVEIFWVEILKIFCQIFEKKS